MILFILFVAVSYVPLTHLGNWKLTWVLLLNVNVRWFFFHHCDVTSYEGSVYTTPLLHNCTWCNDVVSRVYGNFFCVSLSPMMFWKHYDIQCIYVYGLQHVVCFVAVWVGIYFNGSNISSATSVSLSLLSEIEMRRGFFFTRVCSSSETGELIQTPCCLNSFSVNRCITKRKLFALIWNSR